MARYSACGTRGAGLDPVPGHRPDRLRVVVADHDPVGGLRVLATVAVTGAIQVGLLGHPEAAQTVAGHHAAERVGLGAEDLAGDVLGGVTVGPRRRDDGVDEDPVAGHLLGVELPDPVVGVPRTVEVELVGPGDGELRELGVVGEVRRGEQSRPGLAGERRVLLVRAGRPRGTRSRGGGRSSPRRAPRTSSPFGRGRTAARRRAPGPRRAPPTTYSRGSRTAWFQAWPSGLVREGGAPMRYPRRRKLWAAQSSRGESPICRSPKSFSPSLRARSCSCRCWRCSRNWTKLHASTVSRCPVSRWRRCAAAASSSRPGIGSKSLRSASSVHSRQ